MNRLTAFRLGFGAVIALLVLSAVEAYRIQESASRQSAEIYRHYAETGDILFRIRRLLLIGSIHLRDQLLSREPSRAEVFAAQLRSLRAESDGLMKEFEQARIPGSSPEDVRRRMAGFWNALEQTMDWSDRRRAEAAYAFLQSEIVPRRNATGEILRNLAQANAAALKDSEIQFARGRRAATIRLFLIVGLCILTAAGVAAFTVRHAERMEIETARRFEEASAARRELRRLSARLLEIQEDERRRIARELHDEIGQTLTALRIEISHARTAWRTGAPSLPLRLEEARELAEKTVGTVRDISLLLRPSLLDDLGIEPALQWLSEDFERRSGIKCAFTGTGLDGEIPDAHRTCVYRLVQEALHNCGKHSGASHVKVTVERGPAGIAVEVQDNGRGFTADRHGAPRGSAGLGILGMRERAASLDGTLKIETAPGDGTRVQATLPLARAEAGEPPAGSRA